MKNIYKACLILLLVCIATVFTYGQNWQWAHSGGNSATTPPDRGINVVVGNNGNIYSLGVFTSSIYLDSNYYIGSFGARFIAEFSPAGICEKAILSHKENINDGGAALYNFNKDSRGNMYMSGQLSDSYVFDTVLAEGSVGGFLAKFNPSARCVWVKSFIANGNRGVAFDEQHNIYSIGDVIYNNTYIDTFALHNLSSTIKPKMYIAKLDSTGKCQWVKQSYGSGARTEFRNVKVAGNNVYASGFMVDSCASFDNNTYCINASFLMKLDTSGALQWLVPLNRLSGLAGFGKIGVDNNHNCYGVGTFDGNVDVGGDTLYKQSGQIASFIIKYDTSGSVVWKRQIYSDSSVIETSSHTDITGNTYITGTFSGTAIFGNDTVTATPGSGAFNTIARNMFVTRYDANGNCLGVKTAYNATPESIATDTYGNAILTGSIFNTAFFDTIQRTSRGGEDYFVAKLSAIIGGSSSIKTPVADNKLMIYANPNRGNFTIDVPKSIVTNTTAHLQIYNTAGSLIKDEKVDISGSSISVDLGTVLKGLYTVTLSGSSFKRFTGKVMVE